MVIVLFTPRDSYYLLVCLILCPENLAWQLLGWGPQIWLDRMWIELHLWLGPTDCYQLSGELSKSFFWLSLGVTLDLESVVSFE